MKISNRFAAISGLFCVLSTPVLADTYDLAQQFSTTSNPSGVWSYGAKRGDAGAFVAGTYSPDGNYKVWATSAVAGDGAHLWRNDSTATAFGNPPGQVSLHGGPTDGNSVVRFTAPRNTAYAVKVKFFAGDAGETQGKIWKNGTLLYHAPLTSINPEFFQRVPLAAGDTLDVTVERNGNYGAGNTPVSFTVQDDAQTDSTFSFVNSYGAYGAGSGQLNGPTGIEVDGNGDIYTADKFNHRIQKFSSSGIFIGDFGSFGTGDGQFNQPMHPTIDRYGNIYVADNWNHRIQIFSGSGIYLGQFGSRGSGNGQLYYPRGMAFDSEGNLYVADQSNSRIQKFTSSGVFIGKFGSFGTGNGQFNAPSDVAIDASGNVFVADLGNNRIQVHSPAGDYIRTIGTFGLENDQLNGPYSVAIDKTGNLIIVDFYNRSIKKFTTAGTYIGSTGSFGSALGQFDGPLGVAVDLSNNVYVADFYNHRIQKFRTSIEAPKQYYTPVTSVGLTFNPHSVEEVSANVFIATDLSNSLFNATNLTGSVTSTVVNNTNPTSTVRHSNGDLYVVNYGAHVIRRYSYPSYSLVATYAGYGNGVGQLNFPVGICQEANGNLLVTEHGSNRVQRFTPNGQSLGVVAVYGAGLGQVMTPQAVCADPSGYFYVVDLYMNRVTKYTSTGQYVLSFGSLGSGNGQFNAPDGIVYDAQTGYLVVADRDNHRLQTFTTSGVFVASISNGPATGGGTYQFHQPGQLTNAQGRIVVPMQTTGRFSVFTAADTTDPSLTISTPAANANGWHKNAVTASFSVIDANPSKVVYSLDDSANNVLMTASPSVTISTDGIHSLEAHAVDYWLNGSTTQTATIKVDITSPSASLTTPTNNTVLVTASDATSGVSAIYITVDNGTEAIQSGATTLTSGTHTIAWRVLDNAGNQTTGSQTVNVLANVSSLTFASTTVYAGETTTGTVTLSGVAPTGGQVVTLASNNSSATAPSTVTVPAGETSATFTLSTTAVSSATTATITATSNISTATRNVTIQPARVRSLNLSASSVTSGGSLTGTVALSAAAGTGGAVVTLMASSAAVSIPATVTVPEGATSVSFTINAKGVAELTNVTILALSGGTHARDYLIVNPEAGVTIPTMQSVSLSPPSVIGGASTTATITLSGVAPANGVAVNLYASNGLVAMMSNTVLVPAGSRSVTVPITTVAVQTLQTIRINAYTRAADNKSQLLRVARPNGR